MNIDEVWEKILKNYIEQELFLSGLSNRVCLVITGQERGGTLPTAWAGVSPVVHIRLGTSLEKGGRGAKAHQFQNLTSGAQDFCSKKFNLAGVQLSVSRFIGGGTGILFVP